MGAFGNNKLAQVAIVVRDIEAAKARWAALLGVEPPNTILTQPGHEVRATYRGQATNAQAKLAFFDLGGVQLELIEPIGEDSAWYEGMPEHGERLHHLAFWTEDAASSQEILAEAGVTLMMRGDMGEGQYAYFDGREKLGAVVELLEHRRTVMEEA